MEQLAGTLNPWTMFAFFATADFLAVVMFSRARYTPFLFLVSGFLPLTAYYLVSATGAAGAEHWQYWLIYARLAALWAGLWVMVFAGATYQLIRAMYRDA